MPVLRGSATFSRFRVEHAGKRASRAHRDLAEALRTHAFAPLDPARPEERAAGFVELRENDRVEFHAGALFEGEHALFAWRVDEVRIPTAVVRAELEQWRKRFLEEQGRPPGRKEKADAKDELRHTLKTRYPLATKIFDVSWDLEADLLQIWAGARKAVDEVQAAVEKAFAVKLVPVVPLAVAARLELSIEALAPTPSLTLPEGGKGSHGQA